MSTGTKSVLFGVHQFLWHPLTVTFAWIHLYGVPKPWELFCIWVHDLGYLKTQEMDGKDGILHPELGANLAGFFFGEKARLECLGHSRAYAAKHNLPLSKLCWADKWSPTFDPTLFYWMRASLSGELSQYRKSFPRTSQTSLGWVREFKAFVKQNKAQIEMAATTRKSEQFPHFLAPQTALSSS